MRGKSFVRPAVLAMAAIVSVAVMAPTSVAAARIHPENEVPKQKTIEVANGVRNGTTAKCPNGDRVVTGGAYWHEPNQVGDATLDASIDSSAPEDNAKGWSASGINASGGALQLTVVAQCLASHSFPAYTVLTRDVSVDPGRSGNAELRCKSSQGIVSGGAVWEMSGQQPDASLPGRLTGSLPDALNRWSVSGRNEGSKTIQMHVTALCAASVGSYEYTGSTPVTQSSTVNLYRNDCDSDYVLGAGAGWEYSDAPNDLATDTTAAIRGLSVTGDGHSLYIAAAETDPHFQSLLIFWGEICVGP